MSNNCRIDIDIQTRDNNKTNELMERIHQMECREAVILREAHELREQNELLEFRIIELEEGCDKVSWKIDCSLTIFAILFWLAVWSASIYQQLDEICFLLGIFLPTRQAARIRGKEISKNLCLLQTHTYSIRSTWCHSLCIIEHQIWWDCLANYSITPK